jgi:hypothetical protein
MNPSTTRPPALIVVIGLVLTAAAFVAGHFLYTSGSQRIGYTIGILAFAPLAIACFWMFRTTGKSWVKLLLWVVLVVWAAMLLVSLM